MRLDSENHIHFPLHLSILLMKRSEPFIDDLIDDLIKKYCGDSFDSYRILIDIIRDGSYQDLDKINSDSFISGALEFLIDLDYFGISCRVPKMYKSINSYIYGEKWLTPNKKYNWMTDSTSVTTHTP